MNPLDKDISPNTELSVPDPISLLEDIAKKLPEVAMPTLAKEIPQIEQYKDDLMTMIGNIGEVLTPRHFAALLSEEFLSMLLKLHAAVDKLVYNSLIDWMEAELVDFVAAADQFVKNAKSKIAGDSTALLAQVETVTAAVAATTNYFGLKMPFSVDTILADAQKLVPELPGFVHEKLADFLTLDLSALKTLAEKLKPNASVEVIVLATASAIFRSLSALFKLVIRALPLNMKFGLNLAVDGTAIGRGSAQADISAGVDVGVGASVPIAGIGGDVGAGAGNSSVLSTTPLTVSLTGLVLGPLAGACDSAVAVLDAIIKLQKKAG